ncbi:hypothetical protein RJ640_013129 [Escallonia rubra]|uniref:Uncharacterized protein n=1 Tax=Escallonia rubra TaxID=112253 RepID=A0AA88USP6_9ASTE|nr:hypothetical protein RJ640_013129 [Escallonia rubra]
MLSGDRKSFREYTDVISTSRSEGASTSEPRRLRRRSISMTPEIGDDIVRAVRAMNETLKQNRLVREQGDSMPYAYSSDDRNTVPDLQKSVSDLRIEDRDELSGGRSLLYALPREHMDSQKAMSLPSSPHEFRNQTSERSGVTDEMVSAWNKVLESPMFEKKPLLPFQEWNIDYSELTVGTRVGIGNQIVFPFQTLVKPNSQMDNSIM